MDVANHVYYKRENFQCEILYPVFWTQPKRQIEQILLLEASSGWSASSVGAGGTQINRPRRPLRFKLVFAE